MKNLFNFYLDDEMKVTATTKIEGLCGKQEKGQLASLIRVMLKIFVNCKDEALLNEIANEVQNEYELTTKKNKRSRM